jgi:hypothetical protein
MVYGDKRSDMYCGPDLVFWLHIKQTVLLLHTDRRMAWRRKWTPSRGSAKFEDDLQSTASYTSATLDIGHDSFSLPHTLTSEFYR